MANSDKRQAALDAIQDILKVRAMDALGQGGMPGMQGEDGGEHDIDIDPELDMPEPKNNQGSQGNFEINDPDGVLDQKKKQKQQKQKQQGGGGGSSKSSSKDEEDGTEETNGGEQGGSSSGKKQNSNQQGGKSSSGSSGDDEDDEGEDEGEEGGTSGKPSNGKQGQKSSKQGGSSSEDGEESENGEQGQSSKSDSKKGLTKDDLEKASKNEPGQKSDEYVKDWNEAIDKFDKDEVSDEDLEKVLDDKTATNATKDAVRAIQASRDRKLEVDPDYDKRLKMPKNSEIKQFEDDGEEESAEDKEKRITSIQKSFADTDAVEADLKNIETDIAIKQADAMRAKRDEQERIAQKGKLLDFSDFSMDLFDTVKSQLDQSPEPEDSYYRPNATYAGTNLLMPGQIYPDRPEIPEINVYFDNSVSFGEDDIKKGLDAIASLNEFEQQRRLKLNIFYFANHLHDTPGYNVTHKRGDWDEGGTGAFPEIVKHVRDSGAENVIILTDDDFQHQTHFSSIPKTEVPGCVWWLWRYSQKSPDAVKCLFGAEGTFQYNFK